MPLLVEGKANMHTDFWESSWQRIDEKRLMEYAERKEQADPIPILETLKSRKAQTVCDAGCGCGAYVRRLAQQGFTVKGFDVSGRAVEIAEDILEKSGLTAELRAASVLKTGYPDNEFDAVVCRDVLDHIPKEEAKQTVRELCRITKPGGIILLTLDGLDEEYQKEPHTVTEEGDYQSRRENGRGWCSIHTAPKKRLNLERQQKHFMLNLFRRVCWSDWNYENKREALRLTGVLFLCPKHKSKPVQNAQGCFW